MPREAVGKSLKRLQDYWLQTSHDSVFVIRAVCRMDLERVTLFPPSSYARSMFLLGLLLIGETSAALTI
jgi:hypothetical protein